MKEYTSYEIQDISSAFRNVARRLSRTDHSQCDANLKRFMAILEKEELISSYIARYNIVSYDIPAILKARDWLDPFEISAVQEEEISLCVQLLQHPYDPYDATSELIQEDAMELWYHNGGKVTHDHWKHLRKALRREIIEYLLALPLNIEIDVNGTAYKLVHGAPMDEYMNYPGNPDPTHFAVWKRWRRYDTFSGDFTMIFGHTPTKYYQGNVPMELWFGNQCIGIDCGSGYPEEGPKRKYGRLACLRLDDGKVFYSEEECYDH